MQDGKYGEMRGHVGIKTVDRKRLWGRSGNRCAICNQLLLQEAEVGGAVTLGEEAHIVAREMDGPRGDSPLTPDQRDEYSNLVLLCPTDHARVDSLPTGPVDFPVERLIALKRDQEERVQNTLGYDAKVQLNEEKWARLIDDFVARIQWERWPVLTANLMDPAGAAILDTDRKRLADLRDWLITRVWPEGHDHLRNLLHGTRQVINDLLLILERDYEDGPIAGQSVRLRRNYKDLRRYDEQEYKRLLDDFMHKLGLINDLALELTRFSNAICDAIRQDIDGSFRFDEGALIVLNGPTERLEMEILRPEFRPKDFRERGHPYPGLEQFEQERFSRDATLGERSVV